MHETIAPTATSARLRRFAACAAITLLVGGVTPSHGAHAAAGMAATPQTALVLPAAAPPAPLLANPACGPAAAGSGADVACELWAKAGTLALPGATVPIWGFAAHAGDPAGTPGPLLQVTAGQTVSLTVHNGLAQPLALALPGVRMGTGGTPAAEDTTGAAANGDRTYTFTAPSAGSYLYEAGHTNDGPRQVAMGLVGAMIVRPANFDATAPTEDGSAGTAFDDEAVLVLSEVDPLLNNAVGGATPTTFDMRSFHPTYRLINGHAYPSTDPIATDHGRTTLVRYVNAGLLGHAMGVLGAKQEVLATNGHADVTRSALVADMIAAGQTEDARVAFPAGGGDKLPVYETAGTLDNAGQVAAVGSRVVGFGGMLTFLQAGPAVPVGDTVGPRTSGIVVSPSPVTPAGATVTATVSDATTGNSTVTRAELFVDGAAVNVGGGTAMSASDSAFDSPTEAVTGAIPGTVLAGLTQGSHTVYVRGMDAQNNWGPAQSVSFTMASTGPSTSGLSLSPNPTNGATDVSLTATGDDSSIGGQVVAGEFFVDPSGTPTAGTGDALTLGAAGTVATGTGTISLAMLAGLVGSGSHTVSVHFQDDHGLWGPLVGVTLRLDRTAPALGLTGNQVTPNPTNGLVGDPVDPTSLKVHASLVDPVVNTISSPVVAAEGFLDNASGAAGTGIVFVADDGSWNSASESGYGLVPLSQLTGLSAGQHVVYVHGKDAAGNWGTLAPIPFTIDRGPTVVSANPSPTASVLAGPTTIATATTTNGTTVTAAEYYQGSDPGAGNGKPVSVSGSGTAAMLSLDPRNLPIGTDLLLVRAKDSNGIWGKAALVSFTVTGLFADGFESGNTAAWASVTGPSRLAVLTAAAIDGTYGLRATASTTLTAFVQRTVTPATTAIHVATKVSPQTLGTGTSTSSLVTLLQARNGTGSQLFAVQLRNNPTNGRQVRLVVQGGTASAQQGIWTSIGTGTVDLRVDRTGTGATTLTINGSAVAGSLASGTNLVANLRLGIVTVSGSSAGMAYLDSFGATN